MNKEVCDKNCKSSFSGGLDKLSEFGRVYTLLFTVSGLVVAGVIGYYSYITLEDRVNNPKVSLDSIVVGWIGLIIAGIIAYYSIGRYLLASNVNEIAIYAGIKGAKDLL